MVIVVNMSTPPSTMYSRKILVPCSPRRKTRSQTPTGRSPEEASEVTHPASATKFTIDAPDAPAPEWNSDGDPSGTMSERSGCQPSIDQKGENSPLLSDMPKDFARSKSQTHFRDSETPDAPFRDEPGGIPSPLNPSFSVESADIALPSVEAEDDISKGDHLAFSSKSESEHQPIAEPTRSASPQATVGDRQLSLARGLDDLSLSSPTPDRSLFTPSSKDLLTPMSEEREPVTVRSLLNATPRPSPAPGAEMERDAEKDIDEAKRSFAGSSTQGPNDSSDEIIEEQQEPDLTVTAEDFEGEDSDFLDDLDRLHIADQYDVRSVEPLPASPFSNPDFQGSLKRSIGLAKAILDSLDKCELAAKPGTQLHRLRQQACCLSLFDYPAKRRIGIVGDSGAGELSFFQNRAPAS